ncbi:MAG: metal-dependent hydrolase [Candidatus Peribacteraceae bacterium]|jgi:membrane-bound metal-dependent hydrolase YbcI (DUF457 family)
MSVTAHFTEQFLLKKSYPWLNFRWLLIGAYAPDGWGMSKVLMTLTGNRDIHRMILFGWSHSLMGMLVIATPVFLYNKRASISFLVSGWLHVLTDTLDSIGTKLFFPFSNKLISLNIWPWTDVHLLHDLYRYYIHPIALGCELFFLAAAIWVLHTEAKGGTLLKGWGNMWKNDKNNRTSPSKKTTNHLQGVIEAPT